MQGQPLPILDSDKRFYMMSQQRLAFTVILVPPALVPLAKRDLDDGRIGIFVLPQEKNIDKAIEIIGKVPLLENAIRLPTKRKQNEEGSLSS